MKEIFHDKLKVVTHELIGLEVVEEKGKGTMGGLGSVGGRVISGACSQRIEAVRHLMWAYQFATSPPRLAGNPRLDPSIP